MNENEAFRDRDEAGRAMAAALAHLRGTDVVVLGLPRGGVPVAAQVARRLDAPLDVLVVRKLGVPGREELAMGAIASGGTTVLNREVVEALDLTAREIAQVAQRELEDLHRRERAYRGDQPPRKLDGKTVVLVDELVCLRTPQPFRSVGEWYEDFRQLSDDDVRRLLAQAARGADDRAAVPEQLELMLGGTTLPGQLVVPAGAPGLVLFCSTCSTSARRAAATSSSMSRCSPRGCSPSRAGRAHRGACHACASATSARRRVPRERCWPPPSSATR